MNFQFRPNKSLLFLVGLCLLPLLVRAIGWLDSVLLVALLGGCMHLPQARLCVGPTLSVPEILMDVMDAFKLQTPALSLFSTDYSSKTAVLGDKITAHIDTLPVAANYDPTPGRGFYNGAQDIVTLISDVPVTLNQFKHVPIKIGWLTQLSSRLPLYQRAIRNYGYVLGKLVVDAALAQVNGNFTGTQNIALANSNLDTLEIVRGQLNIQKAAPTGRFGLIGTPLAAAIQNDDRVKSNLFYGVLNGNQGYRTFSNIAGFEKVIEYPDFPAGGNQTGFFGDGRAVVVANRRPDFSNVADQLGVPKVMEFYPMEDDESGLQMTGVAWQEAGTGDVYVSAAILFGIGAGKQGGAAGAVTDKAGFILTGQ